MIFKEQHLGIQPFPLPFSDVVGNPFFTFFVILYLVDIIDMNEFVGGHSTSIPVSLSERELVVEVFIVRYEQSLSLLNCDWFIFSTLCFHLKITVHDDDRRHHRLVIIDSSYLTYVQPVLYTNCIIPWCMYDWHNSVTAVIPIPTNSSINHNNHCRCPF